VCLATPFVYLATSQQVKLPHKLQNQFPQPMKRESSRHFGYKEEEPRHWQLSLMVRSDMPPRIQFIAEFRKVWTYKVKYMTVSSLKGLGIFNTIMWPKDSQLHTNDWS